MNNSGRRVIGLFVLSFFGTCGVADETKFTQLLHNCTLRKAAKKAEKQESVFLRAYPFDTQEIALVPPGKNLLELIVSDGAAARLVDHRFWQRARPVGSEPGTEDISRLPTLLSVQTNGDGVLIARGTQLLAFPRFLLLNPLVQKFKMADGDFVSSFRTREDEGKDKELLAADPVWSLLFKELESEPDSKPIAPKISISAPDSRTGGVASVRGWIGKRKGAAISSFINSPRTGIKSYEELLYEPQPDNTIDQKVFVFTRLRSSLVVHYIIPFKASGAIGSKGRLFRSILKEEQRVRSSEFWTTKLEGFAKIKLRDGDGVAVMPLTAALSLVQ